MKKIAVLMGSDSDLPAVKAAFALFREYGVPYEAHVMSAHRSPEAVREFSAAARERGLRRNHRGGREGCAPCGRGGCQHDAAGHWHPGEIFNARRAGCAACNGADAFGHAGGNRGHRWRGERGAACGANAFNGRRGACFETGRKARRHARADRREGRAPAKGTGNPVKFI